MNIWDVCNKNNNPSVPIEHRLLNIINTLRVEEKNYHLVKLLWDCKSTIEWQYTDILKLDVENGELKEENSNLKELLNNK